MPLSDDDPCLVLTDASREMQYVAIVGAAIGAMGRGASVMNRRSSSPTRVGENWFTVCTSDPESEVMVVFESSPPLEYPYPNI